MINICPHYTPWQDSKECRWYMPVIGKIGTCRWEGILICRFSEKHTKQFNEDVEAFGLEEVVKMYNKKYGKRDVLY